MNLSDSEGNNLFYIAVSFSRSVHTQSTFRCFRAHSSEPHENKIKLANWVS